MNQEDKEGLIRGAAWLFGGLAVWNILAVRAEANAVKEVLTDKNAVYVIEGARPLTNWALGETEFKVTTDPSEYGKDARQTSDGKPIVRIRLEGVRITGWMRMGVRTNLAYANGSEQEGTHHQALSLTGFKHSGYDREYSSFFASNGQASPDLMKDWFDRPLSGSLSGGLYRPITESNSASPLLGESLFERDGAGSASVRLMQELGSKSAK